MKENWIQMPHPGHFIGAYMCRFRLNTYVNGYIVSTVGEYLPPEAVLRSFLEARRRYPRLKIDENGKLIEDEIISDENLEKLLSLKGDHFEDAYLAFFGFEELGLNRTYETMVFKAKKQEEPECQCCPWVADGDVLEMEGYNTPVDATKGHWEMCEKAEIGNFEEEWETVRD